VSAYAGMAEYKMNTFLNGQRTDSPLLLDRALHYGDGLFETMAIRSPIEDISHHPLLTYHLKRLQHGCERLFFPALEAQNIIKQINNFLAQVHISQPDFEPWVLKLILTRGVGQRGYAIPECQKPNIILIQSKWPSYAVDYSLSGIRAEFSKITLYPEPNTAGVKHLNRLTQVLASQSLSLDCQEAVLLDDDNFAVEGIKSNLFAVIDGQLHTPCLNRQGILGVTRAWILDLCRELNIDVKIFPIQKANLLDAEQIFVCNSIMGIWPIIKLESKQFVVGDLSRHLQHAWEKLARTKCKRE
tara:strand:- start:227702 stop:228601 length:900 start_codon:yes stop_codon:yes gene_type:complete